MKKSTLLNPRSTYLQVALNSTLAEAHDIIRQLPRNDRIIIEAGTPLIKRYGAQAIRQVRSWWTSHLTGGFGSSYSEGTLDNHPGSMQDIMRMLTGTYIQPAKSTATPTQPSAQPVTGKKTEPVPYIVADMKMMDRGEAEVQIAAEAGANAVVAVGHAPIESLDAFITACHAAGVDAMIDMMNVEYPLTVLRQLQQQPQVVILHRGVDEEEYNKQKQLPLHEIRRIKSNYDIMIAVAGGDTPREIQSAVFNDADIVVVWKSFYQKTGDTAGLAENFLKQVSH